MCLCVWSVDVESPDAEFYDLVCCLCVWSVDVESPDADFYDVCVCVCGL